MISGTMSMQGIVWAQGGMWYIVMAPVAGVMFFIANLAETGRAPFDLLEAESEIIAGYNIEYSGFKWGMFMAAEFMHFFTVSLLTAVIFFGGWWGPGVEQFPALGFIYLGVKTAIIYLFGLLIRSTVPRVRIDQLMGLNWKWLVPISVANVVMMAFLLKLVKALGLTPQSGDFIASLPQTVILLLGNLLIIGWVLNILRNRGRSERMAVEITTSEEHEHEALHAGAPGH
jgi:NADH-quinone oxidoreductase subunit H